LARQARDYIKNMGHAPGNPGIIYDLDGWFKDRGLK
jgi:hypothetical protein